MCFVVVYACFCLIFIFYYIFLNKEYLAVVRLGWVYMRACGGAHRKKSRFSRGYIFDY